MQHYLPTNLQVIRSHRKMSQQELSDMLGVARSRYAGWEREVSEPNIAMLLKLRTVMGCSLNILLTQDLRGMTYLDVKAIIR